MEVIFVIAGAILVVLIILAIIYELFVYSARMLIGRLRREQSLSDPNSLPAAIIIGAVVVGWGIVFAGLLAGISIKSG
ncbi:MAG: hypothetical protein RLY93_14365 [Sumerlaeia bacterium]